MGNSNLLFEKLFKRKLSDAGTRQYLADIVKEHPYFSPAHFYLLSNLNKDAAEYQQQAAKTAILFNNPFWLQFQLQEITDDSRKTASTKNVAEEISMQASPVEEASLRSEPMEEDVIIETASPDRLMDIPPADEKEPVIQAGRTDEIKLELLPEQAIVLNHENAVQELTEVSPGSEEPTIEPVHLIDESDKADDTAPAVLSNAAHSGIKHLDSSIPVEDVVNTEPTGHFLNEGAPLVNDTETGDEDDETETETAETATRPLNFKLNIDTSATTDDTIIFEPLHTSDYFASQGIKLSSEIPTSDKLGRQLKSFTEWLKTMKKVHGEQLPLQSAQAESSIQQLAEQSNKDDTVVTEAMAEVLVQQGKAGKAIEVYKKLSLLNPAKSTFFAAKIDQLKER